MAVYLFSWIYVHWALDLTVFFFILMVLDISISLSIIKSICICRWSQMNCNDECWQFGTKWQINCQFESQSTLFILFYQLRARLWFNLLLWWYLQTGRDCFKVCFNHFTQQLKMFFRINVSQNLDNYIKIKHPCLVKHHFKQHCLLKCDQKVRKPSYNSHVYLNFLLDFEEWL